MTIVQQIRTLLKISGLSPKEFELLMLYDFTMLRLMAFNADRLTNREILQQMAPRIGAGICGEVANKLTEILLGQQVGAALQKLLNQMSPCEDGELRTGQVAGKSACWGRGAKGVRKSVSNFLVLSDALYLINLGAAHRFVAVKQKGEVELLQTWYDPEANLGYALTDWLSLNNTRVSRTVDQFITDLGKMSAGSRPDAKKLFQPVGGPYLPEDRFDLGHAQLTFAAVQISSRDMGNNLLTHFVTKSAALV